MGDRRVSHRHSNGCELVVVVSAGKRPVAEAVEAVPVGAAPMAVATEIVVVWGDCARLVQAYLGIVHVVGAGAMAVHAGLDKEIAAVEYWGEEGRAVADERAPLGKSTLANYC